MAASTADSYWSVDDRPGRGWLGSAAAWTRLATRLRQSDLANIFTYEMALKIASALPVEPRPSHFLFRTAEQHVQDAGPDQKEVAHVPDTEGLFAHTVVAEVLKSAAYSPRPRASSCGSRTEDGVEALKRRVQELEAGMRAMEQAHRSELEAERAQWSRSEQTQVSELEVSVGQARDSRVEELEAALAEESTRVEELEALLQQAQLAYKRRASELEQRLLVLAPAGESHRLSPHEQAYQLFNDEDKAHARQLGEKHMEELLAQHKRTEEIEERHIQRLQAEQKRVAELEQSALETREQIRKLQLAAIGQEQAQAQALAAAEIRGREELLTQQRRVQELEGSLRALSEEREAELKERRDRDELAAERLKTVEALQAKLRVAQEEQAQAAGLHEDRLRLVEQQYKTQLIELECEMEERYEQQRAELSGKSADEQEREMDELAAAMGEELQAERDRADKLREQHGEQLRVEQARTLQLETELCVLRSRTEQTEQEKAAASKQVADMEARMHESRAEAAALSEEVRTLHRLFREPETGEKQGRPNLSPLTPLSPLSPHGLEGSDEQLQMIQKQAYSLAIERLTVAEPEFDLHLRREANAKLQTDMYIAQRRESQLLERRLGSPDLHSALEQCRVRSGTSAPLELRAERVTGRSRSSSTPNQSPSRIRSRSPIRAVAEHEPAELEDQFFVPGIVDPHEFLRGVRAYCQQHGLRGQAALEEAYKRCNSQTRKLLAPWRSSTVPGAPQGSKWAADESAGEVPPHWDDFSRAFSGLFPDMASVAVL